MKPLWLVLAAALAAFLVWRRRRLEPTLLAGGVLVTVGMAVYGTGLVKLPNVEHLLVSLGNTLGAWTYLLVAVMAFFETGAFVGLIAPGETVMLVGGLIAGQGPIDVFVLIGIAWASAVAGDVTSLYLGRRLGRSSSSSTGRRSRSPRSGCTSSRGSSTATAARRSSSGASSGSSGRSRPSWPARADALRRFLPYDVIGAGLWTSTFILLGYVFWHSLRDAAELRQDGGARAGDVDHGRRRRGRRLPLAARGGAPPRADDADRRGARPAAAAPAGVRAAPGRRGCCGARALFAWNRLTPGELGLELTTLLAIVAVGSFAFVANAVTLSSEDYAALDLRTLTMARDLAQSTRAVGREGRHGARVAAGGHRARARHVRAPALARRAPAGGRAGRRAPR